MKQSKSIASLVSIFLAVSMTTAGAETPTREETVKILQQKYVSVLDTQHATLLAIKEKMKVDARLLKQVNSVLADFDSNYAAIVKGLANENQDLQPIIDLCEEEVEEFGNSIYQLQQMVKKIQTIQCVKGKTVKKIAGLAPKCPIGFKLTKLSK